MEALQMLKFSLRSGHILDFTAGMKAEYDLLELMIDEEADAHMGGGNTFIRNLLAQNDL